MKIQRICDVVVIGAGPAGLSAALYAARQKVGFCIISKDVGGLANFIPDIESYLGYHYISGYDLIKKFKEHLKEYAPDLREEEVKKITKSGKWFLIKTNKGLYKTRTLIVATGRRFKRLNIKGEKKFENKGLSFCAACDGPLFRNKDVAVIGGGLSGILSALFIMPLARKIYLTERTSELGATSALRKAIENAPKNKVVIMKNTDVLEVFGDKFVKGLKVRQNGKDKILNVEGVFVEIGYDPNVEFVKGLVKLNHRNEIIVDKNNNTSVKGIYAAGDVTDIPEKQVIIAVGEGAKAAMNAILHLEGMP